MVLRRFIALIVLPILILALRGEAATTRILIVGDSWGMQLTSDNYDNFPSNDVFDDVLAANGLGDYVVRGAVTARGGRSAAFWANPTNLASIVSELNAYPSIDCVHLITGGIDFLEFTRNNNVPAMSPATRDAQWTSIATDIQTIVDACLAVRPDIRVLIADYDYLDYALIESTFGWSFSGATVTQMNTWFTELGQKKLAIAQGTDRCEYVQNWGTMQYWFGSPAQSVPYPGAAPAYTPYPGGDIASPMPSGVSADGVHPNDAAHTRMLQNAVDQYYADWLAPVGLPLETRVSGALLLIGLGIPGAYVLYRRARNNPM